MSGNREKRPRAKLVKGFKDSFWGEAIARAKMVETIRTVYERYGFLPIETPALEYVDALGKYLGESNRPDEGIYAFESEEEWVALRYDLTAPLSRVIAQYQELPKPFRRYQVGNVWRMEKPGPGRYREFLQFDLDTVGTPSMAADAEICCVLAEAMRALGIPENDFIVRINNRKVVNGVLEAAGVKLTGTGGEPEGTALDVMRSIDKLDRLGIDGVRDLLTEGRKDASGAFMPGVGLAKEQADRIIGFLSSTKKSRREVLAVVEEFITGSEEGMEGQRELRLIDEHLTSLGCGDSTAVFDPTVVRGLAYYTGPVFEVTLTFRIKDEKGRVREFGSVAGGGRYDDLVRRFTGQKTPATGASIGVDRLLAALMALDPEIADVDNPPVVVTAMDTDRMGEYLKMTGELRDEGISAETYLGRGSFNRQMKYADKRGAFVAVIAGSDEFEAGKVTIKDLRLGRELSAKFSERAEWLKEQPSQVTVPRKEMVKTILEMLKRYET